MSGYPYMCEHCQDPVRMTLPEFNAVAGVVICDDCKPVIERVSLERKIRQFAADRKPRDRERLEGSTA